MFGGLAMPDVCAEKSMWIAGAVLLYNFGAKSYPLPVYVIYGIPVHDALIGLGIDVACRGMPAGAPDVKHATNALVGVGVGCVAKSSNFL